MDNNNYSVSSNKSLWKYLLYGLAYIENNYVFPLRSLGPTVIVKHITHGILFLMEHLIYQREIKFILYGSTQYLNNNRIYEYLRFTDIPNGIIYSVGKAP